MQYRFNLRFPQHHANFCRGSLGLIDRAVIVSDRDGNYDILARDEETFRQLVDNQAALDVLVRDLQLGWAITIRRL